MLNTSNNCGFDALDFVDSRGMYSVKLYMNMFLIYIYDKSETYFDSSLLKIIFECEIINLMIKLRTRYALQPYWEFSMSVTVKNKNYIWKWKLFLIKIKN